MTWSWAVVFARYFLHQLQLSSHDLAAIWLKSDEKNKFQTPTPRYKLIVESLTLLPESTQHPHYNPPNPPIAPFQLMLNREILRKLLTPNSHLPSQLNCLRAVNHRAASTQKKLEISSTQVHLNLPPLQPIIIVGMGNLYH